MMMRFSWRFVIWLESMSMLNFIKYLKFDKKIFKGAVVFIALVALIIVYSGALAGTHDFYPNDKVSSMNVKEAVNSSGDYPYWFPWMMGGIPSVHSFQNVSDYYFPNYFFKALNFLGMPWFWNFVLHLFFGGVGIFVLLRKLNIDRFSSAISGMAFSIMPHVTAMLVYGHGSQIMTIAYMPWVFYSYLRLRENTSLSNLGIFSLIIGLQILRGHPQIAYYTWLMLGLCLLVDLTFFLINRKIDIKFFLFTIVGLALGVLSSLSLYLPSLSYLPYSNRVSDGSGGMGFENATEYSFSFGEILTFFIPSYYGFGNQSYWGSMTMTNFPNYMGILVLLFAFYGLIRYKWTVFKWFLLVCLSLFLILSFGGDFYRFLYDNLFYFSKFRNPMYMLIVVQFCTVTLAAMGIKMVFEDLRSKKIFLPIFSGISILLFSLIFLIFKETFSNSVTFENIHNRYKSLFVKQYPDMGLDIIEDYLVSPEYSLIISKHTKLVQSMISSDINTMAIIVAFCFLGILIAFFIYPYIKSSNYLMYILSALIALSVFFDIFVVNQRLMYPENTNHLSKKVANNYLDFYDSKIDNLALLKETETYVSSDVVKEIKSYEGDDIFPFRILDPKRAHSNEWARHQVENILGYHPAHLSSYSIIQGNPFFYSLMNVKYQIVGSCAKGSCLVDVCILNNNSLLLDYNECIASGGEWSVGEIFGFEQDECPDYASWKPGHIIPVDQEQCSSFEIQGDWIAEVIDYDGMDRAFFIENILLDREDDKVKRLESPLYNLSLGQYPSFISYITKGYESLKLHWKKIDNDYFKKTSSYTFKVDNNDKVIDIDNSNPNELYIKVSTSGPQFLAISEIYYPNGWYASINGKPVEIFEVNDLIRGVFIEAEGEHMVRMWYNPSDLIWGRWLSWIAFVVIFAMVFSKKIRQGYLKLT